MRPIHLDIPRDGRCAEAVSTFAKGPIDRGIEANPVEPAFKPDLMVVNTGETVLFLVTNSWLQEHEFRLATAADAEAHIDARC